MNYSGKKKGGATEVTRPISFAAGFSRLHEGTYPATHKKSYTKIL
jgi:hypothetical protein